MSDGLSGEKKRLEQYLLQSRASNVLLIDPRYSRFQPEKIDTIRLRLAQIQAGKQPVSEKLIKEQQKKKKKGRVGKQLRGGVARAILEQKRFERGERRDRPEEEPRIVGEPRNTGLAYDPDIERRKLDIQEQLNRDANLRALMDRRAAQNRLEQELAVRRGELAAGRAERRLERERLALLPAPAPIVIPPAQAPNINVEAPQVRVEAPQVRVDPTINIPPLALPARGDADPIPEIERLGALIRQDMNAFGAEQRALNQDVFTQVRGQARRQEEIERRQYIIDEEQRQLRLRQDANLEEIQARLGMTENSMGRARDAVIQEIRDAEARLRRAAGELDRPINYDDVLLRAAGGRIDRERPRRASLTSVREPRRVPIEEASSTSSRFADVGPRTSSSRSSEPQEPTGIEGIIEGGGPLDLPNIVIERPRNIGPDQSLRLSPSATVEEFEQQLGRLAQRSPRLQAELERVRDQPESETASEFSLGIPAERLRRGGGRGTAQYSSEESEESEATTTEESEESELQFPFEQERRVRRGEAGVGIFAPPEEEEELAGGGRLIAEYFPQPAEQSVRGIGRPLSINERASQYARAHGIPTSEEIERQRLVLEGSSADIGSLGGYTERSGQAYQLDPEFLSEAGSLPESRTTYSGSSGSETGEVGESVEVQEQQLPPPHPIYGPPGYVQQVVRDIETGRRGAPGPKPPPPDEPPQPRIYQNRGGGAPPVYAGERVIEDAGIQAQPVRQAEGGQGQVEARGLVEEVEEEEGLGQVADQQAQLIRDSKSNYNDSIFELSSQVRQGPRGARGQRGGLGYRVRNNTDKTLKRVKPGDVVNVIGVEQGATGRGRYRLDTETAAGTRIELDELSPLINSGAFLFEKGHRHELGGHFDREPYGPPPEEPLLQEEPGYLQQGAQAVGGAVAGLAGAGARGVAGLAQGVAQGLYEQLPGAGDVGAALGRGVVSGVAGAGRLAAGAVQAAFGGSETGSEVSELAPGEQEL